MRRLSHHGSAGAKTEHIDPMSTAQMHVQDGKSIITGWSDGNIRGFGPETGKEQYTIHDAHHGAVAALAGTADSARIISGGTDGNVRVWDARTRALIASMTEHQVPPSAAVDGALPMQCVPYCSVAGCTVTCYS